MAQADWTIVTKRKKIGIGDGRDRSPPPRPESYDETPVDEGKIPEPCWFYNNGGCRHKDGTEKGADICKYKHIYSTEVRRPPHLCTKKPCDKFNLEGDCKWHDNCKYSHRNLTPEEWSRFYPGIPYTLRTNIERRIQMERQMAEMESHLGILKFKQDGLIKEIQRINKKLNVLEKSQCKTNVHDPREE